MAESRSEVVGRWRMQKRTETKPDGRKIYYYHFEKVETQKTPSLPDSQQEEPQSLPTSTAPDDT